MRRFFRPLYISATALLLFCAFAVNAAPIEDGLSCAEAPGTSDIEPNEIIEQTNAFVARIETAYNEARKGLTDQQRAYLDQLVAENRAIAMIDADLIVISSGLLNCNAPDAEPTLEGPFADALQKLSAMKGTEKRERYKLHFQNEHKATFIDERILREYLQVQLMKISGEMAETAIAEASLMDCEEAKSRLAEYHLLPGGTSLPGRPAK